MKLRQQLPVYSPISFSSVLTGAGACISGKGNHARDAVRATIAAEFAPHDLVLTNSGTSALTLAILSVCEQKGRRLVALPAYGCYDVATAADGADVEVVLYDLRPDTLSPDLHSLKAALEQKPAAVVLVHLYGVPIDFDVIRSLIENHGVLVIEDAAQGQGASFRGRALGALGSLSILSFGRGKGVTGGSGGALLANDESGMTALRNTRLQLDPGKRGFGNLVGAAAQWFLARPSLYGIPASLPFLRLGETIYKPPYPALGMPDTAAGVLARTWSLAQKEAETRTTNGARLLESVTAYEGMQPTSVPPASKAGYLRFPVVVENRLREFFDSASARKLGIVPGYPSSLADLPGFTHRCVNGDQAFPAARTLATRLFTLPTHGMLGDKDVRQIQHWLKSTARVS